jgi:hypothetical protein
MPVGKTSHLSDRFGGRGASAGSKMLDSPPLSGQTGQHRQACRRWFWARRASRQGQTRNLHHAGSEMRRIRTMTRSIFPNRRSLDVVLALPQLTAPASVGIVSQLVVLGHTISRNAPHHNDEEHAITSQASESRNREKKLIKQRSRIDPNVLATNRSNDSAGANQVKSALRRGCA